MTRIGLPSQSEVDANLRVSSEIRAWLGRRQLTQKQLAQVLEISQGSLSFRMKGKTGWGFGELMKIAGWLDISLSELLGEDLVNAKGPHPVGEGLGSSTGAGVAVAGLDPATSRL